MPNELHRHYFRGVTTYNDGHVHQYAGATSADPDIPRHIHYMEGRTSFNDGHTHYYAVVTGPEIEVDGGHYHYYEGATAVADRHVHYFRGFTSIHRG